MASVPGAPRFLWGASTAAHQIEGGNVNSDWWRLEHSGRPLIKEPSGDACDSYHRWPEDMDLLAGAGFTDYRFSVEWARIEPAPGEFSRAQLDHYRRMVDGAHERGLRPMVTLHHFTNPVWFAAAGGWRAANAVERFVRYVEALAPVLADGVDHVCVVNEPNVVALMAAIVDNPAGGQLRDATPDPEVTNALILAHHKAGAMVRETHSIQTGWSVALVAVVAEEGAEDAAAEYVRAREGVFLEAARADDWVGVQAYTRHRVASVDGRAVVKDPAPDVERTLTGWEYYPPALGDTVRDVAATLPGIPIIVTENGIATADDQRRIDYTAGALQSLRGAIDDGAEVRGYFHWSLLDNYEWGSYRPTFGLVAVDRATFTREPKPSLHWLGAQREKDWVRPADR